MPDNVDPNAEADGAATGPDVGVIAGEIKILMELDVADDADTMAILIAIRDKLKGGAAGEGEDSADATAAATEIRKAFGLKDDDAWSVIANAAKNAVDADTIKDGSIKALTERLVSLEKSERTTTTRDLLEKYADKINPANKEHAEACRAFAERDPEKFEKVMRHAPDALPSQGRTGGGTSKPKSSRDKLIKDGQAEYARDATLATFSERHTINVDLFEAHLPALTDEEVAKHGITHVELVSSYAG